MVQHGRPECLCCSEGPQWRQPWAERRGGESGLLPPLSKMQSLFTRCDSTLTQSMISPPGVPIARSASGVLHGELPSARSPVDPLLAPRSSSLAPSHRDQRRGCRCSARPRCPGAQRPTVAVLSAYNHARHQLSVRRQCPGQVFLQNSDFFYWKLRCIGN
jgi:hypothetical protein